MTRSGTNFIAAVSRWLAAPGVLCRFVARSLKRVLFARAAILLLIAIALAGLPVSANAQDEVALDYQVKAAFLVNFPKYIDWPSDAFSGTNASITVAVFGDDNVANEFQNMIQSGLVIDGHPVVLKRIKSETDIAGGGFQILFIATSERARVSTVLEKLKGSPVLLVGE